MEVLRQAVEQVGELLGHVSTDQLADPTPCTEWAVGDLVDHLVADCTNFLTMMRGEQPDWSTPPEPVRQNWDTAFRSAADDLVQALSEQGDDGEARLSPDWMTAEFAAHSWDLARAIGQPTNGLDPVVAQRGLSFMQANLTDDRRSPVFGPEQVAGPDANAYDKLAAFAGRPVDQ